MCNKANEETATALIINRTSKGFAPGQSDPSGPESTELERWKIRSSVVVAGTAGMSGQGRGGEVTAKSLKSSAGAARAVGQGLAWLCPLSTNPEKKRPPAASCPCPLPAPNNWHYLPPPGETPRDKSVARPSLFASGHFFYLLLKYREVSFLATYGKKL